MTYDAETRITRLSTLVTELLANYEQATGRPATMADEIRSAMAEVEEIPEQERKRRRGAARIAFERGQRSW